MTERTIKGKIAQWSEIKTGLKKDTTVWYKISCNIAGEWHAQFVNSPAEGKAIMEANPINSDVEFVETQNGQYWGYKINTWQLHKKGEGVAPRQETSTSETKAVDWDAKDRRIVRQNAIGNAMKFVEIQTAFGLFKNDKNTQNIESEVFRMAAKIEDWVYRDDKPDEPIKEEEAVM